MKDEKEFHEELLKENSIEPHGIAPEDRQALQRILKRDKARAHRMKWITKTAWILFFVALLGCLAARVVSESALPLERHGSLASQVAGILTVAMMVLFYGALFFSASYAIRSWIAQSREFQFRFTEIEARLAGMEEGIKRLAEKG